MYSRFPPGTGIPDRAPLPGIPFSLKAMTAMAGISFTGKIPGPEFFPDRGDPGLQKIPHTDENRANPYRFPHSSHA
jgi:hypothetical protein